MTGNPEEALNRQRLLATLLVMLTLGASKGRDGRGTYAPSPENNGNITAAAAGPVVAGM